MAIEMSILISTKKALGLAADYTAFDPDIVMHINAVFADLNLLGVGPDAGFMIEDDAAEWDDFLGLDPRLNNVKTYVYLRVRALFDPPDSAFVMTAMQNQIQKAEWQINVQREGMKYPWVDSAL